MKDAKRNLSNRVIGCAITVHKTLGDGYLEAVYERALAIEMEGAGIRFVRQSPVAVHYRDSLVGNYFADFLVENRLLLELKASKGIDLAAEMQLLHYLKGTGFKAGLLLNFGTRRLQIKRMVLNLGVERSI